MAHHNFVVGQLVKLKSGTMPITVSRVGGDSICGHYGKAKEHPFNWRKAGAFAVNDMLVLQGAFHTVKSINTRNRRAPALPSDTRRILTEVVGA